LHFNDFPEAYGHLQLKTWGEWAGEYIQRAHRIDGMPLHEAIQRAERDGFDPWHLVDEHNLVENVGFNLLLSFLAGSAVTGLQYVALGTLSTPPTGIETQLPDEQLRIPISSLSQTTGQLTATGYFDTSQANITLGSAALFGNGATGMANSGTISSYVT